MKKILMIAWICLLLTGCGSPEVAELIPAETLTPAQTLPQTLPQGLTAPDPKPVHPMPEPLVVRFSPETLEGCEPGVEMPILRVNSNFPRVWMPGNPEAEKRLNTQLKDLEARIRAGEYGYDAQLQYAKEQREELQESFSQFYVNFGFSVQRGDSSLLSLRLLRDSYLGGAYGTRKQYGLVFDSVSGEKLSLQNLSDSPEDLRAWLLDQMEARVRTDPDLQMQLAWYDGEHYREGLSLLLDSENWYLDNYGLVIFSDEDQLGPHAAGTLEFRLSYEQLGDRLKAQYRPEPSKADGDLSLTEPEGCNARILDDLTLTPGGKTLMLGAKGRVDRVELKKVAYDGPANDGETLWYGEYLEDCVLRLDYLVPGTLPDLLVRVWDRSGEEAYVVIQSGQDGSYFLSPAE